MIVKMKKLTLICLASDRSATLDRLRELGVLHLTPCREPESDDLDRTRKELDAAQMALGVLRSYSKTESSASAPQWSARDAVRKVQELSLRKRSLSEKLSGLLNEEREIEPFGDFDPDQVRALAEAGVFVRLYHTASRKSIEAPENTGVFVVSEGRAGRYFAIVGRENFEFEGDAFDLPARSLSAVRTELDSARKEQAEIEEQLAALYPATDTIKDHVSSLEEQRSYLQAQEGMGSATRLAYLQGFCPVDQVPAIESAAKDHGWGLRSEDPADDDEVPTLVRYPAWVRMMKPVFTFLGITPGYKEADVSSSFLVFLSIFFAMIVGDAGYGILFLILIPYFRRKKFSKAPPEPFRLLYVFSITTVAWGILTANYFGINYELLPSFLRALRIEYFVGQENSMTCALFLGAVHLTLAHLWQAVRLGGRNPSTLAELGWISIVWVIYALARMLVVQSPLPPWFWPLLGTGLLLIVVGLWLQKLWMKLGLLVLDSVSCFGDVMSYLRLFALGIASVEVAAAFNDMAAGAGAGLAEPFSNWGLPVIGLVLAAVAMLLILIVGHGLNIILCGLSVLVHGIRLNAMEFSLHSGQEWSGTPYRPFAAGETTS